MENDSISSSSSSESKLPLIVGIVGFALGAAGLVLGLKAKSAAEAATNTALAAQQDTAKVSAELQSKAAATELAAIGTEINAIKAGIAENNKLTQDAITALQTAVKKPVVAANATGTNGAKSVAVGPGEYAVAKGDTLGGIAKKVGLSLKVLQDLNPGVNANKMQIGQKLKTK
jgi:LysM repeat protein